MAKQTLEFLNKILDREQITPADLDQLVANQVREDQYLDYKSGKLFDNPKTARETVREYLSAFANSEGGVLIIGVNNKTWMVDGATAPGGGPLDEWASRCVEPIAPYFSPLPRFQVVAHPTGNILIASVDRSLNLVPNIHGNVSANSGSRLSYHLRIHDQTIEAPEYLINDLVLGKRQHPFLQIIDSKIFPRRRSSIGNGVEILEIALKFTFENASFFWAKNTKFGIISHDCSEPPKGEKFSHFLRSYIDVAEIDEEKFPFWCRLDHKIDDLSTIPPFTHTPSNRYRSYGFTLPLASYRHWVIPYKWQAAIYLVTENAPPIWYQVEVKINAELTEIASNNGEIGSRQEEFFTVTRLVSKNPYVGWVK